MKETIRIQKLFEDMYNEEPWIDVTIKGTLENMLAEKAAKKISPQLNSIWEITNHIIRWKENILQRVQGHAINSPANNYFEPIIDQSEKAWQNTLETLMNVQLQWTRWVEKMNEADLEKIYPDNNATYYKNIHGILQHDAYHLGQIVLLAKVMEN